MNNKSFKKKFISAAVAFLIAFSSVSASFMSGCKNDNENSATNDTGIVSGTIDVSIDNGTDNSNEPNEEQAKTESDANADSQENSGSENNSGSQNNSSTNTNSGNDNNSGSANGGSGSSSGSASTSSSNSASNGSTSSNTGSSSAKPSGNTLTLDGKKYSVGDKVTYAYSLTCPEVLVNYQGIIKYDSSYLKVTSAKLVKPATNSGMINKDNPGSIVFVGSEISEGYDYRKKAEFLTVTYEVIGGGESKIDFQWQYAWGFDMNKNNEYAKDNKPSNGAKIDVKIS